jgi:sulfide:quinone oxidoreductase
MERQPTTVLVAGGGVAALETALALRELAEDRVDVELLGREPRFWYRAMSVAEPFGLGEVKHFELADLAAAAGATFSLGALSSVDAAAHIAYTSAGTARPYDVLVVACGAAPQPAVPGAITFRGPADTGEIETLLADIDAGEAHRVAFVVPWGAVWSLPVYELALMTAARSQGGVEIMLVTPEHEPLEIFGSAATEAIRSLLNARGVELHTGCHPVSVRDGELLLYPDGTLTVDRVVALPRLLGQRIDGIAQTIGGFVPVDEHGRAVGVEDVYAAGDITGFPVKQGGIAAQQADAAAEAIAVQAGVKLTPTPFRPVLRGLLLTGGEPRYLRRELHGAEPAAASAEPLWWPPDKVVGRYLGPFLASIAGGVAPLDASRRPGALPVEIDLTGVDLLPAHPYELAAAEAPVVHTIEEVMASDPLIVAPEDTLGEVAELMRERDIASALVAEYGRLIGIITARDLLRAFAGRVHSSEARVRQWMTAEPVTASRSTTLTAAGLLMSEYGVHHLPVVDDGRPVGMVGLRAVVAEARPAKIGLGF